MLAKYRYLQNEIYVFGGYDRKGARGARRDKKIVEAYDTGFRAVEANRKLPAYWEKLKKFQ